MRIRRALLAAAAALAVIAAGCGGGGGDRLTKEEFIAAADEICKATNDELDALGSPESIEEVAQLADDAVGIQEDGIAELRELSPPEADQGTIDEALDLIEQQVEIGKEIAAAAADGDQAKIEELIGEIEPINEQADQIAQEYGLTECGNN